MEIPKQKGNDDFLTKCFEEDTENIELVLQIVLEKPDLKVLDIRTQVFAENLLNRSVRLDILTTDSTGTKWNVEVRRSDKGAGGKQRGNRNDVLGKYLNPFPVNSFLHCFTHLTLISFPPLKPLR